MNGELPNEPRPIELVRYYTNHEGDLYGLHSTELSSNGSDWLERLPKMAIDEGLDTFDEEHLQVAYKLLAILDKVWLIPDQDDEYFAGELISFMHQQKAIENLLKTSSGRIMNGARNVVLRMDVDAAIDLLAEYGDYPQSYVKSVISHTANPQERLDQVRELIPSVIDKLQIGRTDALALLFKAKFDETWPDSAVKAILVKVNKFKEHELFDQLFDGEIASMCIRYPNPTSKLFKPLHRLNLKMLHKQFDTYDLNRIIVFYIQNKLDAETTAEVLANLAAAKQERQRETIAGYIASYAAGWLKKGSIPLTPDLKTIQGAPGPSAISNHFGSISVLRQAAVQLVLSYGDPLFINREEKTE